MQVFDDIASIGYQDELVEFIKSGSMFWNYYPQTSGLDDARGYDSTSTWDNSSEQGSRKTEQTLDTPQFVHEFFLEPMNYRSQMYQLILPMIFLLEKETGRSFFKRLYRVKANLLLQQEQYPEEFYNMPHVDINKEKSETFLYYVDDSDGDTVLFNEGNDNPFITSLSEYQRITPKKGRGVLFDSSKYHASTPPKQHKDRIVINFVFTQEG